MLNLAFHKGRIRGGQIYLVYYRNYLQVVFEGEVHI